MFTFASLHRLGGGFKSSGRPRSRRRAPARNLRPRLEALETYQLMSTFTVVLATDSGGPNGQEVTATSGDLRYCIEQADATHSATSDTIDFSPVAFGTPQTITLNSTTGSLVLDDSHPLTINGPTGETVTLSGGNAVLVLDITKGKVSINDLTISDGKSNEAGGIENQGTLMLTDCTVDHGQCPGGAGGLFNDGGTATIVGSAFDSDSIGTHGYGGGIFNAGTLTVTSSIFTNDSAANGGAIFNDERSTATLSNCTLSDDWAGEDAGGVFVEGTVTMTHCTVNDDSAGNGGGGVCTDGGTANLTDCTFNNDSGVVPSGRQFGGGGVTNSGGTVNLTDCKLTNDSGVGLWNEGLATVTGCTFSNDSTTDAGGGIDNSGSATVTAKLLVTDSTFSNDSAAFGGGAIDNDATASFTNCTFANDYATASTGGGAIWNQIGAGAVDTLTVTNCTIADNNALSGTGGGIWNQGALTLVNTIVAENTAALSGRDVDNTGTVSTEHNLIGNGKDSGISTKNGNIVGQGKTEINPLLGPLQDNPGPTNSPVTDTMALLAGSPAIGKADNALAAPTDQRGEPRTGKTDIGAYEVA